MAKYRTRDWSRSINPFTGEPWRTPKEFFSDASANSNERKLIKCQQKRNEKILGTLTEEEAESIQRNREAKKQDSEMYEQSVIVL